MKSWSDETERFRITLKRVEYLHSLDERYGVDPFRSREILALEWVIEELGNACPSYVDNIAEARGILEAQRARGAR